MGEVVQFEAIKHGKEWEDEYPKYLGHLEKYFGTKTNTEMLFKRIYYTLRFLEGTINAFLIFSIMGVPLEEYQRGKKFLVDWLEDILKNLKGI